MSSSLGDDGVLGGPPPAQHDCNWIAGDVIKVPTYPSFETDGLGGAVVVKRVAFENNPLRDSSVGSLSTCHTVVKTKGETTPSATVQPPPGLNYPTVPLNTPPCTHDRSGICGEFEREEHSYSHPRMNCYQVSADIATDSVGPPGSFENGQPARSMKIEDAINYLDAVKEHFSQQPEVYSNFLDIMKEFKSQNISTECVIDRVKELFHNYPSLIMGFNVFLPEEHQFTSGGSIVSAQQSVHGLQQSTLDGSISANIINHQVRVVPHVQPLPPPHVESVSSQSQQNVDDRRCFTDHVLGKTPILSDVVNQSIHAANSNTFYAVTPIQHGVSATHHDLFPRNAEAAHEQYDYHYDQMQLHSNSILQQVDGAFIISSGQQIEYEQAVIFVNKIKNRLTPDKYKQFLEILHGYRKQQRSSEENPLLGRNPLTERDIYVKVSKLFEHHLDLMHEFFQYVPTTPSSSGVANPMNTWPLSDRNDINSKTAARISGQARSSVSSSPIEQHSVKVKIDDCYNSRKKAVAPRGRRNKRKVIRRNELCNGIGGFDAFLSKIKNLIPSSHYKDVLRIIQLYNKDLFSQSEVIQTAGDILRNYPQILLWLKNYIGDSDGISSGSEMNHRSENTTPVKPLCKGFDHDSKEDLNVIELDVSTLRRLGQSYCQLPKNYETQVCSGRTPLCDEVLNDEWLSVPVWTEVVASTNVSKKNPVEETMSRIEDERFECDFVIQTNAEAIKCLDVVSRKMNDMSAEERAKFQLDDCLGSRSSIHVSAIKRIYGEEAGLDIIEGLKQNPAVAVPLVIKRLKQKDEEWRSAMKLYNKFWKERSERFS